MRFALLAALVACGDVPSSETGGTPTGVTGVQIGECEGAASRSSAASAADFAVAVDPEGRWVVHLDNLVANCCPSPVAQFTTGGVPVVLDFTDVSDDSPCDCVCVTDFVVTSAPFEAGAYEIEIHFNGAVVANLPVNVP